MDAAADTYKYARLLNILLEAAVKSPSNPGYNKDVISEANQLLMTLTPTMIKGKNGEALHDVFHSYSQVFVEIGYDAPTAIRILQVLCYIGSYVLRIGCEVSID